MIPVLVLFALLSGCALVDRAADLTGRAFTGGRETTPAGDPLSLHLQLALLSDRVVTRIVQDTETPLDAIDDPNGGRRSCEYAWTTPPRCGTRRRAQTPTPTPSTCC